LPGLLISEGLEVNVNLFRRMREILRKIDVFWARSEPLFDVQTFDVLNMESVQDEEITSGGEIILNVIVDAVSDYLRQLSEQTEQTASDSMPARRPSEVS
jgi:hypothetical protein